MPKRWRIDMSLFDEDGQQVGETKSHEEEYDTEEQARKGFDEKERAARAAGKGSKPTP